MVAVETKKSQVSCNEGNGKKFIDIIKKPTSKNTSSKNIFHILPFLLTLPTSTLANFIRSTEREPSIYGY